MKQSMLLRVALITTACLLLLSSFFSPVHAQTKNYYGLIISPPINEFKQPITPGETVNSSFTLTNDYGSRETVTLEYHILDVAQKDAQPVLLDLQGEQTRNQYAPLSMKGWINVNPKIITLAYGQTMKVDYSITVPLNATPGGRYSSIFFQRAGSSESSGSSLSQNLGHIIFLTVAGDIKRDSELVSFTTDRPWYDFLPVNFLVNVRNNGNVHTNVGGNIFVYKGDITKPVANIVVNPNNGFILPFNERIFTHTWNGGVVTWVTLANGKRTVQFDWSKFPQIMFGKYHAQLKLRHDVHNERITTTQDISFWVIPWEIIVPLVLLLGLILWRWLGPKKKRPYTH